MMGKLKSSAFLVFIVLYLSLNQQTESFTHTGREFHLGFFKNRHFAKNPQAYLLVTVAEKDSKPIPFVVEIPKQGFKAESVAFSGRYSRINLPDKVIATRVSPPDRAVLVKADANSKGNLVVVGMNEDEASTDAYLGLPVMKYTSDVYEYIAFSTKKTSLILEGNSVILMVASEDDTEVTIKLTQDSFIPIRNPRVTKGQSRTFVLNRLGMTQIYSDHDLTGSYIRSNKPLAVFVGHECGNVPFNLSACDHLLEQVPPTDTWGLTYHTSPLLSRTGGDLFRLAASKNGTLVKMSCIDKSSSFTREREFKMNQFEVRSFVIGSSEYCRIQGTLPIFLVQYSQSHSVDEFLFTDPYISIVQPYEQFISSYSLIAIKGDSLRFSSFVNLMIPTQFYQPENITIDDVSLKEYRGRTKVITELDFADSQDMVAVSISLTAGSHFISHTSPYAIFSALMYGYADQMSYGYPGGFGLSPISVSNLSLEVATLQIREDKGPLAIQIRRSGLMGIPATVTVATQEIARGARVNKDFLALNEVIHFEAGEKVKDLDVIIIDNFLQSEPRRPFRIMLILDSPQAGVALVPEKSSVEVVILDNDIPVVIELLSKEYALSEGDQEVLRVGVRRTGFIVEDIVVSLEIRQKVFVGQDGVIENPREFTVVFNASNDNETETVWVDIPITDDNIVVGNRRFIVQLIIPQEVKDDPSVILGSAQSAELILLEDDVVTFDFENSTVVAREDDGMVVVCVKKIGNTTLRLRVGVTSTFGSARDGSDFMAVNLNLVFEPSETRKCLDVSLLDDDFPEELESFSLVLVNLNGENAQLANDSSVEVNIVDDDVLSIAFKDDVVVGTEGLPVRICIDVTGSIQNELVFNITVTGGNATYPNDGMVNLPGGRYGRLVIISSGLDQRCFDVALPIDDLIETDEFFEFTILPTDMITVPVEVTKNSTILVIKDSDLLIFGFSGSVSVKEGETASLCVRKNGDTKLFVSVLIGLVDSSDSSYADMIGNLSLQVDFPPNRKESCADLFIPNDAVASGAIQLEFQLIKFIGGPLLRAFLPSTLFFVNIADDDELRIGFNQTRYSVVEGNNTVTVCLVVPGEFRNQEPVRLTVSVESFNTNATIDSDYVSLRGQMNIRLDLETGETSKCLDVVIVDDDVHEPNEVIGLVVELGPESPQVRLSPRRTSILIEDNDDVVFKMKSTSLTFNENNSLAQVCIVREGKTVLQAMVDVMTENGTAVANEDFVPRSSPVIFSPDDTEQCVFISIANDRVIEPVESFFVVLSAPPNTEDRIIIGVPRRTEVFLEDNDFAVCQFEETNITVSEGDGFTREVCLLKEGMSFQPITVRVVAEELPIMNTASPTTDLTSSSISFTFPPSATRVCRPLRIINDSSVEYDEILSLSIVVPSNGPSLFSIGDNGKLNVTILNDDSVTFSFGTEYITIIEGEPPKSVCVTMEGTTAINLDYNVTDTSITAFSNEDYVGLEGVLLNFGPSSNEACFEIVVLDDTIEEIEEMFLLSGFYVLNGGTGGGTAIVMVSILDDDSLTFSVDVATEVLESSGSVEICVSKTGNTAKNFSFNIVPSGSAQIELDYRLANTSITIPAITSEVCFTVDIIDDELLELNEVVNLTLLSDDPAAKLSAVFTINDDDPVEIMFENARYSVNESAGEVPITVAINGTVAVPLPFSLLLFPITANGSDFVDANISKSLALFSNTEELAVRIINDALPEGEETFRAVLMVPEESAEAGIILSLSGREAVVTIKDDDVVTVEFSGDVYNVSEGEGVLVVRVESSVPADNDLSLGVSVSEGTAKFGSDVVERELVVVIAAGSTVGMVSIDLINDETAEEVETFSLALSIMTPESELLAKLGQPSEATVRVADDDAVAVEFERERYVVDENTDTVSLRVVSSRAATYDVLVEFAVTDVLATSGLDYEVITTSPLTVAAGDTEALILLRILNDTVFEGNETLQVTLSSVRAGGVLPTPPSLGPTTTAVVSIVEDDHKIILSFENEKYIVSEDVESVELCLVTEGSGVPVQSMTIPIDVTGQSAQGGKDFTSPNPSSVTFVSGQSKSCISVNITDDTESERMETFVVAINHGDGMGMPQGVAPGRINQSEVMIRDNDDPQRQCVLNSSAITPFHRPIAIDPPTYPMRASCEHVLLTSCGLSSRGRVRIHADFNGDRFDILLVRVGGMSLSVFPNATYVVSNQTNVGGDDTPVNFDITSDSSEISISVEDMIITRNFDDGDQINISIVTGAFDKLCGLCGNEEGALSSISTKPLQDGFSTRELTSFIKSWRTEEEDALIPVVRQECATMRNDSLVLDPLLTVPLYVHEAPGSKFRKAALCYEIRGHSNAIYNLVSDMCVAINGEFVQMPAPRQHLNALGSVGMVAIDNAGQCLSLIVRHEGDCVASVNGQPVQTSYNRNGISIARSARHVHIKVPDCDHVDLTMWVMCQRVEGYNMMKYVVTRGLNMHPTSHGLIGQFWNVPVIIKEANYTSSSDLYKVSIHPPDSKPRSFYAEYNRYTWTGERTPCLYAGTSQGHRHSSDRDSVIEGHVSNYHVDSLSSTEYMYSKFNSSRCSAGPS